MIETRKSDNSGVRGPPGGDGAKPPGWRRSPHDRNPPNRSAFTLIELLVTIAIISLLISILVPALSRARETSRRTICGSNIRQFAIAMLNYSQDNAGWFPCKWDPSNPAALPSDLTARQSLSSSGYGPNLTGIVRDIIERRHTREAGLEGIGGTPPQYLPDPKILLCPSDTENNPPGQPPDCSEIKPPQKLWPIQEIKRFSDLPRTNSQANSVGRTFLSYYYIALWRNDDRGDFPLLADQSNRSDDSLCASNGLNQNDNHGTRGQNVGFIDSHVEWQSQFTGEFTSSQTVAMRIWGPVIAARPRYDLGLANRSSEVRSVE
jgi:prepilin-type N-terminal cleavage/methylation domain-containing protein